MGGITGALAKQLLVTTTTLYSGYPGNPTKLQIDAGLSSRLTRAVKAKPGSLGWYCTVDKVNHTLLLLGSRATQNVLPDYQFIIQHSNERPFQSSDDDVQHKLVASTRDPISQLARALEVRRSIRCSETSHSPPVKALQLQSEQLVVPASFSPNKAPQADDQILAAVATSDEPQNARFWSCLPPRPSPG